MRALAAFVKDEPRVELNIEGNPFPEFLELVLETMPTQCTLVPDAPDARTSDRGWDLAADGPHFDRSSKPYGTPAFGSAYFSTRRSTKSNAPRTSVPTNEIGLGVNAGHDLALVNLRHFCRAVPGVLEVSIGHALISHAVTVGLRRAVQDYLDALRPSAG